MTTTNEDVRTAFEEHRIVQRLASDPPVSVLEGGEVWYNTIADEYRGYETDTGIVAISTTTV
ncbi:hypothetical protein JT689_01410 (plasmid) [Halobacterium sp. GSL-19]|uniref:hypothetical protein n=1 Tax=Halobacterium sp. GSL-19 TaxID=2812551 RepID=UPI001965E05D|nr:hypothetical protein [Halobacterium sp. GSL-19]QRY21749.1 hypothetical protein JT689_01410 [Halobacterium sp. GSL-19]